MASAADRAAVRKFQRQEHYRALSQPPARLDDGSRPGTRVCGYCHQVKPDTSGYWPPLLTMHPGFQGDTPCNDCMPGVMASFAPKFL